MWATRWLVYVGSIKDRVGNEASAVQWDVSKQGFRPRGFFSLSKVGDVLSEQVVFNFLSVILASPFRYLLGVVGPLVCHGPAGTLR